MKESADARIVSADAFDAMTTDRLTDVVDRHTKRLRNSFAV